MKRTIEADPCGGIIDLNGSHEISIPDRAASRESCVAAVTLVYGFHLHAWAETLYRRSAALAPTILSLTDFYAIVLRCLTLFDNHVDEIFDELFLSFCPSIHPFFSFILSSFFLSIGPPSPTRRQFYFIYVSRNIESTANERTSSLNQFYFAPNVRFYQMNTRRVYSHGLATSWLPSFASPKRGEKYF